ncbi:MAG: FG-GAP-like repeat-containing protein, partial [Flavipsychrobacter sp.]
GGASSLQGEVFILFMNKSGTVDSFTQIREHHAGFNDTLAMVGGFGVSVANIGDLDNDGINDLAVGNSGFQNGKGSVWILFMKKNGTVKSARQISSLSGDHLSISNKANFGTSVCRLGDLDGDGHPDIMVGDFKDSTESGEAWALFLNADGSVKSYYNYVPGTMTFPDTVNAYGFFGYSVASIGDIDGDSVTDVAIGAYQYIDSLGEMPGRVWIAFLNKDGSIKATQIIDQHHGNFSGALHDKDNFGCSLATIGDFNKDRVYDLCVGAQDDDDANPSNPNENSGAIYFLYLNGVPINTGIGDIIYNTTKDFFVYPNPSSDMMIIRSKDPNEMISSVHGLDMNGKECFEYKNIKEKSLRINVLDLPAGDYIIKVNTINNTTESIHFVKH